MQKFKAVNFLIICSIIIVCCSIQSKAQQIRHFDSGINIGVSINYGGIYYENSGNTLNDNWSNSYGYQFHMLYGYKISSALAMNTGAKLFVNRYKYVEQRNPETTELGEPTGNFISTSMAGTIGSTYIGIPVNLIIRPIGNKSFYTMVGPEISHKVSHSNGTLKTVIETDAEEDNEVIIEEAYDIPERSNNTLLFVNVGLGYSFDTKSIPLNIELGVKQAVTPYMSGDNFISSWMRNLSVTVSYRL